MEEGELRQDQGEEGAGCGKDTAHYWNEIDLYL